MHVSDAESKLLNKRKISDSPPFVGDEGGGVLGWQATELRIILWELIPQSWELATPPPSPMYHSFLNNFFVTETQYFSDMWGGKDANSGFQILFRSRNIRFPGFFNFLAVKLQSACFSYIVLSNSSWLSQEIS